VLLLKWMLITGTAGGRSATLKADFQEGSVLLQNRQQRSCRRQGEAGRWPAAVVGVG
jgi:hypothetical protein